MSRLELASSLLRFIGSPSSAVAGTKSFLPADDRVGLLLNSISPSMMARLARQAIGRHRGMVDAAGSSRLGRPSMARVIRLKSAGLKLQPSPGVSGDLSVSAGGRPAGEHRFWPVGLSGPSSAARPFNEEHDRMIGVDGGPAGGGPPPLGWPWEQPPPTPSPPQAPPRTCPHPPCLGTIIDLFA